MKNNKLVKKGFNLVIVILIIKALGFLKQSIIAWRFGTSPDLDVYFAADGYISMYGQIILTAIPPAIITLYLKMRDESKKEAFISSIVIFLVSIGLILTVVNVLLSPLLTNILGVSFSDFQRGGLSNYIMILSPLILLACISSVSSGVLQSKNVFIPDKLLGLYLSLGIITCAYFLAPNIGIYSLLIGFMMGYSIYFIMMLILLLKNTHIKIQNPLRNKSFIRFLRTVCPIIIGVCIVDLSHLVDRIIASSLTSGSVSSLYYSQIVSGDLINGVIIASIGILLLPKLSTEVQVKTRNEILKNLKKVLVTITPVIGLITAMYIVAGEKIVSVLFQRGEFTQESTIVVGGCVIGYAIGFVFMLFKEVLVRYFYAFENTKIPMVVNIVSIVTNIVLSIILSSRIGVQGIAYATSISYFFSDLLLLCKIKLDNNKSVVKTKWGVRKECVKNIIIIVVSITIGIIIQNVIKISDVIELVLIITSMGATFVIGSLALRTTFGNFFSSFIKNSIKRGVR